ncbi:MAG: hypothetical protein FWE71_12980 [Nocardioidaceae bacterium]|nr:hypothetical protein [Nocardioidaceae bacterium]MCL2612535.1 hypothetical protein [Nocardioidaceae bacterium]
MTDERWEPYEPPASAAERQGEPGPARPPTPYDDLPVAPTSTAPRGGTGRSGRSGRWRIGAGAAVGCLAVVAGLAVIGLVEDHHAPAGASYSLLSDQGYAGLLDALRKGPGTRITYLDLTSDQAQVDVRTADGGHTQVYDYFDGEGLTPLMRNARSKLDGSPFDLAGFSASQLRADCAQAAASVAGSLSGCDIALARPGSLHRGWVDVSFGTVDTDFDRRGHRL